MKSFNSPCLAIVLLVLSAICPASAQIRTYRVSVLPLSREPVQYDSSVGLGADAGLQVGYAGVAGTFNSHAILWFVRLGFVDIHPAGASSSQALAVAGSSQVGWAVTNGTHARMAPRAAAMSAPFPALHLGASEGATAGTFGV